MKRILLFLTCVLTLFGVSWGANVTLDLTNQGYTNAQEVSKTDGPNNIFTISYNKGSNTNTPKYYTTNPGVRVYGGGTITISSSYTITKIEISYYRSASQNSLSSNVGTVSLSGTNAASLTTWTGSSKTIVFTVGNTSSYASINKVVVTYEDKIKPTLSFPASSYSVKLGENFNAPTLSCNSTGAITYKSSKEDVATVDNQGNVTLMSVGTTTITATVAETNQYESGSASYTLVVTNAGTTEPDPVDPPKGDTKTVTFDFTKKDYGLPNNSNDFVTSVTTITEEPVKMKLTGGSEWRYWGDGLRAYTTSSKEPKFTLSVPDGKITGMSFTGTSTNFKVEGATSDVANKSWSGSEESITFVYTGSSGKPVETVTVSFTLNTKEPQDYTALNNQRDITIPFNGSAQLDLGSKHPDLKFTYNPERIITIDAEGIISAVQDQTGTTTVTVSWEGDDDWNAPTIKPTFNVTILEKSLDDVLTADKDRFNMSSSTYTQYEYTSNETGVKYSAKAGLNNGIQINTTTSTATSAYSGIASIENPEGLLISNIAIEKYDGSGEINVEFGNTPCETASLGVTGTSAYVKPMTNPIETLTNVSSTAIPSKDAKYFRIYTNGKAVQFTSITVSYKNAEAPELGEIQYTIIGDKTIEEGEVTVDLGDNFTFTAKNAESISLTVTSEEYGKESIELNKDGNGSFSWTVDKVYERARVEVTATLGDDTESLKFLLSVNTPTPAVPSLSIDGDELENGGQKVVSKGQEITISSENAKVIIVKKDGEPVAELTEVPFKFPVNESGIYTFIAKNGDIESELFTYTFTVGEVDPNMPKVGSNFRQILNGENLEEDYYVIARAVQPEGGEWQNNALSTSTGSTSNGGNITSSQNISAQQVVTWESNTDDIKFNLLTTTADDVLIVKLVKQDGEWGIRTVNLGDKLDASQKYLAHVETETGNKNDLSFVEEFTPADISLTVQNNVNIKFEAEGNYKVALANNNYFNYQTSGSAIQLYRYTTADVFVPAFEDLVLEEGDEYEIVLSENAPEVEFRKVGNTTIISLDGNKITANRNDEKITAVVEAIWGYSEKWFAGKARFNVNVLITPELEFRHEVVRGKKDIGVLSQAAYYNGDGEIRYSVLYNGEPTKEIKINEKTGMIRPEDIADAVINREYTVRADVNKTGIYSAAYDTYVLIIQSPEENSTGTLQETYDFYNNSYGMFTGFTSTNTSGGIYQNYFEHNINTCDSEEAKNHVPVKELPEGNVTLNLDGNYRYFYYFADGFHEGADNNQLRINKGATMEFSVPEGSKILSITFDGTYATNKYISTLTPGTWSEGTSQNGYVKWTATDEDGVQNVKFTNKEGQEGNTLRIFTITLDITGTTVDKGASDLKFIIPEDDNDVNYYINIFENDYVKLPELDHADGLSFSEIVFDIDEIDEEDDAETFQGYSINDSSYGYEYDYNNIWVSVNYPGVYTFRAKYEGDEYLKSFAILRLNVFPRLNVLPSDEHDSELADDSRTEARELTLIKPVMDETIGEYTAVVNLPSLDELNNAYKYSTISVHKVTVKHGEDETIYCDQIDENETEDEHSAHVPMNEMPATFTFTDDGYVNYHIAYAGTSDFSVDSKVHVVLMPQTPTVEENGDSDNKVYTLTPSKNAKLRLAYEYGNGRKDVSKRRAAGSLNWTDAEATTLNVSELAEQGVTRVYYQSAKDLNDIMDKESVPTDPILESDYDYVTIAAVQITVTPAEDYESIPFVTSGKTTLEKVFAMNENDYEYGTQFNISFAPKTSGWATEGEVNIANALGKDVYAQYQSLEEGINIDGLYSVITDQSATYNEEEGEGYYWYNVTATFPCSGVYVMTISQVDDSGYEFESKTVEVTITPNLYGMFGSEPAFNINGYGFTATETDKIQYPTAETTEASLKNSIAYKPGTYFDSSFSLKVGDSEDAIEGTRAASGRNTSWIVFDLSAFSPETTNQIEVTAEIEKNGASGTFKYLLVKNNEMTSVDAIDTEDGEAAYYTLQGVKVQNPEKGIYIKVVGNKAVKVVI